ncbi:LuxR family transcriptional regulator [Streptomyces sp. IMTB 2501]|uniref:AAA family ATPase n=1 Tax=Streptomyces sp. IMTB 2501 TaxID=1776340 RepID=UPI00096C50D6|nr:LuxR family transcriptional regulator [Streptomyces sp. IMTB 2501]OLZ63796.1 LuxR family transcriptional regulator [Streptomyces sp. IMTB 2501]
MQLFGRSRELQVLGEAFTDSAGGHGRLVIVTGGPGSGKTHLVHEFLTTLSSTDARILTGTTCATEQDRPMSLVGQLLRNAEVECGAPQHAPPVMNSPVETHRSWPSGHRLGHAPDGERAADALLRLADERPLVIAVDDAHAMDRASFQTIVRLLRRSRSRRLLVVCATSGHFSDIRSPAHTELLRQPHRRVRLAPLSEASVGELLAAQAGHTLPGPVRGAYHRATAGNPLLVHALLDDSTRFGPEVGRPVAGAAYRQAVLSLLHRGDASHVRVARVLAALGSLAGTVAVGELTGTTAAGTQEAVDALNSSGLLNSRAFRHPTAAAAVLEDMSAAERTELHGRIAHLLYRSGVPAVQVARHLHAAGLVPEGWGAGILRAAAEQALAADDVERCTDYLGLVLRDCADDRERHALSVALARAEWRTNPAAAGPHLEPLRKDALDGGLNMRDTATVLRYMLWRGDTELAAQAVASLVHAQSPTDAQIVAEVEFVRQWFYGVALPGKGAPVAGLDPRRRHVQADTSGLGARLAALIGGEATDESAAAVAQALQGHQLDHLNLELVAMSLLAIAHADRPALAAEACDALLECAVERRATTWQALLGSIRAEIALLQGDVTTASQGALTALGILSAQSWGVLVGLPLSTAIAAYTAMGSYAEAEELLGHDVPEPMFRTVFGIQYLRARGHHYLATDRPFAALNDFETCGRLLREGNPSLQKGIPWRSDLALANLRIGKARTAREWAEEQLRLPGGHSSRARAMALRLLAATCKPHRRASLLRESIDLLKTCGDRYALAQAYADLSAAHYELGEYARARLVARQAAQEAEACRIESPVDAHLLEDPVRPESSEAEDGPAILSDAECRVAGLAALGYTNREISGRLHVTISTVEQHLTRVYRKLQVASRSELPSKMLEHRIPKLSDRWASTHTSTG